MARNKHPEETVRRIVETAARLFTENGYEKTSIQEIIDSTGLSKGAIYHHFKSKEDIFVNICELFSSESERVLAAVRDDALLTGLEKLNKIFCTSIDVNNKDSIIDMVPYLIDNPKFLAIQLRDIYTESGPDYIAPILDQCVAEGSLKTKHPRELAEAILILSVVWLHPLFQPTSLEVLQSRFDVFMDIMRGIGIEMENELREQFLGVCRQLNEKDKRV